MKTMRYRIRVIALFLVASLLMLLLWIARALWFPPDAAPEPSAALVSPAVSASPLSSPSETPADWVWTAPVLSPAEPAESPFSPPAGTEAPGTPEPLYDTYGL